MRLAIRPRLAAAPRRPCLTKRSLTQARCFNIGSFGRPRLHTDPDTTTGKRKSSSSSSSTGTGTRSNSLTGAREPRPLHEAARKTSQPIGKTAVITGGSRGIGWSIASRLALDGVGCTLVGRDEAVLQAAVDALPGLPLVASGGTTEGEPESTLAKHQYVVGDVRDSKMWASLFSQGPEVHFLVNAAGISHYSVLTRLTPADIHDVLDTNLYGTTIGCRAAMRAWIKNRHVDRCIVNISSLLALRGGYGAAAYAASKAGVIGLTRAVAGEGSTRRVRANVILPGYIESSMTASLPKGILAETIKRVPSGRLGRPDEVADAALFLIRNKYANNCVLNLDGGLSAAT